ncbi:MAG: type II toxin-antitoxin system HicB family antitoxin [Candidatus Rokuibacteriota bacterium]
METAAHLIENTGLLILGVLAYSYVGRWLPSHRPEGRRARQLVTVPMLPGGITEGGTLEEARERIK